MPKVSKIQFAKYHGLGNDFIVARGAGLPRALPALARSITDRHTGVGADGFIVTLPPLGNQNNARIRFFNADGSEPEMSGNGIRCAGAFLYDEGSPAGIIKIETIAGVKTLKPIRRADGSWTFEVNMGKPILNAADIPFKAGKVTPPVVAYPLNTRKGVLRVTVTSMGNPHCSTFVRGFESMDWAALGAEIERNPRFPNRTNVEFVRVISRREIEVRFWERGVGKTNSSGTGSCGAVAACVLNGLTGRRVKVRTLAGHLEVKWPENGEVILTGPVVRIARGTFDYVR